MSNSSETSNVKVEAGTTDDKSKMTVDQVMEYALAQKLVSEGNQAHFILNILLDNPDGVCRHLYQELANKSGRWIGQGGTRVVASLRDNGINIPKGKKAFCTECNKQTVLDKLEAPFLLRETFKRTSWNKKQRKQIHLALAHTEAFSGEVEAADALYLEIDHRMPVRRMKQLIDGSKTDMVITDETPDEDIVDIFQLLTRKNNLIKDRACGDCVETDIKPSTVNGIVNISPGDGGGKAYDNDTNNCFSCPFAFPETFGLPLTIRRQTDDIEDSE